MLPTVFIECDIYASEVHKVMQQMLQDFIKNDILEDTDDWEKEGMVSRDLWERAGEWVCSVSICHKSMVAVVLISLHIIP